MKIWFDCEFLDLGNRVDLISLGAVSEDGRTFYAESDAYNPNEAGQWVKDNVFPHLRGDAIPLPKMAEAFSEFAGGKPEFIGWYSAHDWVAVCSIFGGMMMVPSWWPMFANDMAPFWHWRGCPKLPDQIGTAHDALADAFHHKKIWEFLQ